MNNIHLEYNPMFVTASYVTYVDNIDLSKISEHVNYLDKHVPNVRRQRSNAGGFQTEDIHPLPYDFEETGKLFDQWIKPSVGTILDSWKVPHEIDNFSYWYNLNTKYTYNREHIHANSLVSGVYYVKVPSDSGKIVFNRSVNEYDRMHNIQSIYAANDTQVDHPETNNTHWYVPKEGMLVLFPSHVSHYVEQNVTNDESDGRISISFNF